MRFVALILITIAFQVDFGFFGMTEPIPFFIHDGKGVRGYVPGDRELAVWALNAWSRESGGKLRFVEAKNEESALVRLLWINADSGRFGEAQRVRAGDKYAAVVYVRPEVGAVGDELASRASSDRLLRDTIVYLTCVHELGHAVGLPHTAEFEDIMYSFGFGGDIVKYFMRYRTTLKARADIAAKSGLSAQDAALLKALYRK